MTCVALVTGMRSLRGQVGRSAGQQVLIDSAQQDSGHRVIAERDRDIDHALFPELPHNLRVKRRIDFVPAEQLATKGDDEGVLFREAGGVAITTDGVDHVLRNAGAPGGGLMDGPLVFRIEFARGDESAELDVTGRNRGFADSLVKRIPGLGDNDAVQGYGSRTQAGRRGGVCAHEGVIDTLAVGV
jgi:hypothetical protein